MYLFGRDSLVGRGVGGDLYCTDAITTLGEAEEISIYTRGKGGLGKNRVWEEVARHRYQLKMEEDVRNPAFHLFRDCVPLRSIVSSLDTRSGGRRERDDG